MGHEEIKREFKSIEEAFDALPQKEREHCIRVSQYAQSIFLQACAADIYPEDVKVRVRLKPELRGSVAKAALHMNIGKALVPELYHELRRDFTPEEVALYRKHTTDGARLAESLMGEDLGRNPAELNIIVEAIESHHERWDGKSYPSGSWEDETPIIGRIVALADALDHIAVQKHSERPFEYAIEQITAGSGTLFDPALVLVIVDSKAKLKRVFTKFIHQSRAISETETVVKRRTGRPFSLWYRPIVEVKTNKTAAFEAEMRFREKEKDWLRYPEVEHIVKQEGMLFDLGIYFVIELCDTVKRLDACGIPARYMAFAPPPGWLNRRGLYNAVASVLKDVQVEASRLCIEVTPEVWAANTKTMAENLKKLSGLGCRVMFTGFEVGGLTAEQLSELGVSLFRVGPGLGPRLEDKQTSQYLSGLASSGIVLLADGIEKKRHQSMFGRNKITHATSLLIGDYQEEDGIVESELALLEA